MSHLVNIPYLEFEPMVRNILKQDNAFWLDSANHNLCHHADLSRYSFVGCDPFKILSPHDTQDIFETITNYLKVDFIDYPLPFIGGFAGYFSYDQGQKLMGVPVDNPALIDFPLFKGGIYDVVFYADHQEKKAGIFAQPIHPSLSPDQRINYFLSLAKENKQAIKSYAQNISPICLTQNYVNIVQNIREHIQRGDIFQANLACFYQAKKIKDFDPLAFYLHLRQVNPAPFACYFHYGQNHIMSSSPERFLKIEGDSIQTRPIKGTLSSEYPAQALKDSQKDVAENIMIVDMLRNDLAKSSKAGTVKVPDLCMIETYEGLHHLVSTVTAQKKEDMHPIDVFKNALPGGSITGTPKKHAMQIIQQYEDYARNIYCGSAGYIGFNGNMDMNILIRTVACDTDNIVFSAGCGITFESDPQKEQQEADLKAKKILESFQSHK